MDLFATTTMQSSSVRPDRQTSSRCERRCLSSTSEAVDSDNAATSVRSFTTTSRVSCNRSQFNDRYHASLQQQTHTIALQTHTSINGLQASRLNVPLPYSPLPQSHFIPSFYLLTPFPTAPTASPNTVLGEHRKQRPTDNICCIVSQAWSLYSLYVYRPQPIILKYKVSLHAYNFIKISSDFQTCSPTK